MKRKTKPSGRTLKQVVAAIERIAPPELAEEWDRVGLLISPLRARRVQRCLLTIDLTDRVAAEAVQRKADLIVAYHPPLFEPVHRLSADQPGDHRLLRVLEARIPVYSPHTALDAVEGGVNDWLAAGITGGNDAEVRTVPLGPGRLVTFRRAVAFKAWADRIKRFLRVRQLRVAHPANKRNTVKSVALCAGAGISALEGEAADVYLTGEMKHHDILAANERGITVVLSEHTHTERGYLPVLKKRMDRELSGEVEIMIAKTDHEPVSCA